MKNNDSNNDNSMIGAAIGGALNAVGGVVSSAMNAHYQQKMMREQMDWQEKMNQQQQDWQESMWNKTNEYNSASAQLERAKAAGVNPNAVFGNGVGGTATMAQQPTTPTAPNGFSPNFDFGNIGTSIAQLDLMKAQKENIESNTNKTDAETTGINEDNVMKQWNNFIAPEKWEMEKAQISANVSKVISEKDWTDAKKKETEYTVENMLPLAYSKGLEELRMLKKAVLKYNEEINLLKEQQKTQQAQQGVLAAQKGLIGAQEEAQNQENKKRALRVKVAEEYGVDADDLEGNDKWIATSVANGTYDEAESLLTGEVIGRAKKGLVGAVEDPIGTVKGIVGLRRGRKGSVANPRPSKYKTKSGKLVTVPSKN